MKKPKVTLKDFDIRPIWNRVKPAQDRIDSEGFGPTFIVVKGNPDSKQNSTTEDANS